MSIERAASACVLLGLTWATPALAYRPFDGTDADVAAPREFELEAGPLGYEREGGNRYLIAPALVLNYGLAPRVEAVLEGRQQRALDHLRDAQTEDVALSLKSLLREGSLQDASGVSVALEAGLLLPGSKRRLGAHLASIFSWHWPAFTVHLNLGNDLLTSVHYVALGSLILEGPDSWRVRPVAELLVERDFGGTKLTNGLERSALIGAIMPCSDSWSLDLAFRHAVLDDERLDEARLGFTWSFSALAP
jgi:hypothetical protein